MCMIHRTLALAAAVRALAAAAGGAALADPVCHRAAGDLRAARPGVQEPGRAGRHREYGFFNLGANCGALSTG
jgi:hypothetical protein